MKLLKALTVLVFFPYFAMKNRKNESKTITDSKSSKPSLSKAA